VNWNPQMADPVDVALPVASIIPSAPSFRNQTDPAAMKS
jgi:hypothetical protein